MSFACEPLEDRRLFAVGDAYFVPTDPRSATPLDGTWRFAFAPSGNPAVVGFDDSKWSAVTLPHTWNAYDAQDGVGGPDGYARGKGWYRQTIAAPPAVDGTRTLLHFDGASLVASVYVDGALVGKHSGAFAGFDVDVTAALADGQPHTLAVQCDNSASLAQTVAPSTGTDLSVDGGLYRGVSLVTVPPVRVTTSDGAPDVAFGASAVSADSATVRVETDVATSAAGDYVVRTVLADANGTIVADSSTPQTLAIGGSADVVQTATVASPHLWNGRVDPYQYDLYVEVRDAVGNVVDFVHQKVGLRTIAFDANAGFLLNGRPYDLHGVMYQPDRKNQGWAVSDANVREDFQTILDVGATVVRSHVQLPPLFYDLADAAGVVVLSEIALNGSRDRAQTYSYDAFFANAKQQLRELVRQNANRPSAVAWGLYNELQETPVNIQLLSALNAYANAFDPSRPTFGASFNPKAGPIETATNLLGYNRYYGWYYGQPEDAGAFYDSIHAQQPTRAIGVMEYGAGGSPTQHGDLAAVLAYSTWQSEEYQSDLHERFYPVLASRPYLWAHVVFQMFDNPNEKFTGQPNPGYNNKGLVTLDHATKKDSFYYYQANWSDTPVLHLTSSRWTNRPAAATEVKVYANTEAPTVYLNGTLVGTMVSRGYGVWVWPSLTLAVGQNVVSVVATKNGLTYSDTVTWTGTPSTTDPKTAALRGFCFDDRNKNGLFDAGEKKTSGKAVFLDANNNGALDANEKKTTTASDGSWSFTGLAAGDYHVRRVFPSGYTFSTQPIDVTLAVGGSANTLALGSKSVTVTPPPPPPPPPPTTTKTASISGYAFNDANRNGKFDASDTKAGGKSVWLDLDNDGVKDSNEPAQTTASDGSFAFKTLAAGTYRVRRAYPSGYVESTPARTVTLTSGQAATGVTLGSKSK